MPRCTPGGVGLPQSPFSAAALSTPRCFGKSFIIARRNSSESLPAAFAFGAAEGSAFASAFFAFGFACAAAGAAAFAGTARIELDVTEPTASLVLNAAGGSKAIELEPGEMFVLNATGDVTVTQLVGGHLAGLATRIVTGGDSTADGRTYVVGADGALRPEAPARWHPTTVLVIALYEMERMRCPVGVGFDLENIDLLAALSDVAFAREAEAWGQCLSEVLGVVAPGAKVLLPDGTPGRSLGGDRAMVFTGEGLVQTTGALEFPGEE